MKLINTDTQEFENLIYDSTYTAEYYAILRGIEKMKESIIHCKDCKFYDKNSHTCNRQICAVMYENDFCSYGENNE